MHAIVRAMGFTGRAAEVADSFIRSMTHRGHTQQAQWLVEEFARDCGPDSMMGSEDAALWLSTKAERFGIPDDVVRAVHGWHEAVSFADGDPSVIRDVHVSAKDTEALEAEALEILKTDRPRYFRENWDARLMEARERRSGAAVTNAPRTGAGQIHRPDWGAGGGGGGGPSGAPALPAPSGE